MTNKYLSEAWKLASANPLLTIIIILTLGFLGWLFIPDWVHNYQSEQHTKTQIELKNKEEDLKTDAATADAEAGVYNDEGQKAEVEINKNRKTVTERKNYVKKLEKKSSNVGTRAIGNSDIPSDVDLCSRAVALGVRCDIH